MKISAINSYKPNVLNNRNNRNNTAKTPSFGYGGDDLSPIPDDEFKDLTGANKGSTKETIKLIFQIPYQIIKESLGIKPRKNPNEEDPEDFFKTVYPTVVEDDTIYDDEIDEDADLETDKMSETSETDTSDDAGQKDNNSQIIDNVDDDNDTGILMLVG